MNNNFSGWKHIKMDKPKPSTTYVVINSNGEVGFACTMADGEFLVPQNEPPIKNFIELPDE